MTDDPDPTSPEEAAALDAWTPLAPPADFADRVMAARAAEVAAPPVRRTRWLVAAGACAAAAAAAVAIVATRPASQAARGSLAATARTTAALGERGVAVAEADAALAWRIDDSGAAEIDQQAGDVFYRVDPGGPFVVHTPAGDVRVTGTCFRVEVQSMQSKTKQLVLAGTAGAVLASAVVITVYEGHVLADTRTAKTELVAGSRATIAGDGRTTVAALGKPDRTTEMLASLPADDARASRDELVARSTAQRAELDRLRTRVAQLEHGGGDAGEDGRPWFRPSEETLKAWVAECKVRSDEPGFDRFQPLKPGETRRGLEADEIAGFNAAMLEVQGPYRQLLRSLYIEATGDATGADTLSLEAMRHELQEKAAPGEHNAILQRVANERAGLQPPPTDLSKASPLERMFRAYIQLGDQAEAALAKRLGPERAKELRGDGWGSRSNWAGCPDPGR